MVRLTVCRHRAPLRVLCLGPCARPKWALFHVRSRENNGLGPVLGERGSFEGKLFRGHLGWPGARARGSYPLIYTFLKVLRSPSIPRYRAIFIGSFLCGVKSRKAHCGGSVGTAAVRAPGTHAAARSRVEGLHLHRAAPGNRPNSPWRVGLRHPRRSSEVHRWRLT